MDGDILAFLESNYDNLLKTVFKLVNPIKKNIIKTHCLVHKHINISALRILKNDKYYDEFNFFYSFIDDLNEGAVWADQDFKSSNHFFNPYERKGMFGRKNALELGQEYYDKSIDLWVKGDFNKSIFYFGAALHIIQDMTVPQHANIKLLDDHRQYETFIKKTYRYMDIFRVDRGTYILESYEHYVRFNARVALKIYKRFKKIDEEEERFYKIAKCGLPLAKRTTAGAMVTFYNHILNRKEHLN